ncbi:uncharacterized protein LOC111328926 [Stylophora pistillata]|nr:uncharacterized protein LOC111328926 [Stylophora pistillata]
MENQRIMRRETQTAVKQGTPTDDELQKLGRDIGEKWMQLGHCLRVEEPELQDIDQRQRQLCQKGYNVLMAWKQKNGSAATYEILNAVLQHELVQRKDLAEQICHSHASSSRVADTLQLPSVDLVTRPDSADCHLNRPPQPPMENQRIMRRETQTAGERKRRMSCGCSYQDVKQPKVTSMDMAEVPPFDVQICQRKLAEHYKRTTTVPTSVWSKKSAVNIHLIYTRLSWVKEEQTPAGSSRANLDHYTDMFTENKNGLPSNRLLVQGQTGIGKSTFVKKLAMDWAELDENRLTDDQRAILKKFELAVVIDLKKVSKHQSLRDIVSASHIFAEEDTAMKDGLLSYITQNQDKVLLVFDGYDEYHCARNSEIFEIFKGNKLRNCCVLITTRISKADELVGFQDVHAEITGFSEEDRKAFMIRMLGSEAQARELWVHLDDRDVKDLARVPLLLLFFCTLWKKGKLQRFPDSKTKLYVAIVQNILDHNEGKCSSSNFREVEDFKEILVEIGKVALECLLNNDHVFEYDQLSAVILCEESRIMGLLQVSEYAENIRPAGMVSFIHKSIQEFLAAWYVTYRCVPEGNLGGINNRARTLDDCNSLENVFMFICGLSDGGSVKVFEHLTSLRVRDLELDLSKTIPDEQNEKDMSVCDVTDKQMRFIDLVYDSFNEVESKTELYRHCLNCTMGIIFLSRYRRPLCNIAPEQKILNDISIRGVVLHPPWCFYEVTALCESLKFLNCLHIPLKTTENSAAVSVEEFLKKCETVKECNLCHFRGIFHFHSGKSLFYFTGLRFWCDDHAKLFTENFTPSHSISLCPEPSSLKFLSSLCIGSFVSEQTLRSFRTIIRDCKSFESIEMHRLNESALECLEQIPNPLTCRLKLMDGPLSSSEVLKLAGLLPRVNNLVQCCLDLSGCCAEAEYKVVSSITHKTLRDLALCNLRLTPETATTLGRSLSEMSSLRRLELKGKKESSLQLVGMEALFGNFYKIFPALNDLDFSRFCLRGYLYSMTERFRIHLTLDWENVDESDFDKHYFRVLDLSWESIPNLSDLFLNGNPLADNYRVKSAERTSTAFGSTHRVIVTPGSFNK